MDITSLPKGAIYRRFKNKNDIALAAYEKDNCTIRKILRCRPPPPN